MHVARMHAYVFTDTGTNTATQTQTQTQTNVYTYTPADVALRRQRVCCHALHPSWLHLLLGAMSCFLAVITALLLV